MAPNDLELVEEVKEYVAFLEGCCLGHPKDFKSGDIHNVFYFRESVNDGLHGVVLARLKNMKFLVVTDSQDYTGHG